MGCYTVFAFNLQPISTGRYTVFAFNLRVAILYLLLICDPSQWVAESWAVVGTIPDFFQVTGIIISPAKTLWVADRLKKKIDEYNLDGNLIRNVLSDLPGVWSLSYHPAHPSFLWVTFYDDAVSGNNVKRFKIY